MKVQFHNSYISNRVEYGGRVMSSGERGGRGGYLPPAMPSPTQFQQRRAPWSPGGVFWKLPPQQSEGMDLSTQPLRNGDAPMNGQVKEVSVIAANPAKPMEYSSGGVGGGGGGVGGSDRKSICGKGGAVVGEPPKADSPPKGEEGEPKGAEAPKEGAKASEGSEEPAKPEEPKTSERETHLTREEKSIGEVREEVATTVTEGEGGSSSPDRVLPDEPSPSPQDLNMDIKDELEKEEPMEVDLSKTESDEVIQSPLPSTPPQAPTNLEQSTSVTKVEDPVESLLENMFEEPQAPRSVIVSPLTQAKVVAILEEKSGSEEPDSKNPFMQVETELEKMFAGIVEEEDTKPPQILGSGSAESSLGRGGEGTSGDNSVVEGSRNVTMAATSGTTSRKRSSSNKSNKIKQKGERKRVKKEPGASSGPGGGGGKLGSTQGFGGGKAGGRGGDGGLSGGIAGRGVPYVHIVGKKESPTAVTVINGAVEEAEAGAGVHIHLGSTRRSTAEGRTRGPGLYVSTLSSKYNSNNVDPTWICAFCNRRPHSPGGGEAVGDLFGPYMVEVGPPERSGDKEVSSEQRRRGGGKPKSLRTGSIAGSLMGIGRGLRAAMDSDGSPTLSPTSTSTPLGGGGGKKGGGGTLEEVWVHEGCAVWAAGVVLVGGRLVGLGEAVSDSKTSNCSSCSLPGAALPCSSHSCPLRTHYPCALPSSWSLDSGNFTASCPKHKGNKMAG